MTTTDHSSSSSNAPQEDVKDLLARLYREIGISAVAAALEVTAGKNDKKATDARDTWRAPSGKDLAA